MKSKTIARVMREEHLPNDTLVSYKRVAYDMLDDGRVVKEVRVVFRVRGAAGREYQSLGWRVQPDLAFENVAAFVRYFGQQEGYQEIHPRMAS